MVDGDDFPVAAVMREIGFDTDNLAACLRERKKHFLRRRQIGNKVTENEYLYTGAGALRKSGSESFADSVVMNRVELDKNTGFGMTDILKELLVVAFSACINRSAFIAGKGAFVVACIKTDNLTVFIRKRKLIFLRQRYFCLFRCFTGYRSDFLCLILLQTFFSYKGGEFNGNRASKYQIQDCSKIRKTYKYKNPEKSLSRTFAFQKYDSQYKKDINKK